MVFVVLYVLPPMFSEPLLSLYVQTPTWYRSETDHDVEVGRHWPSATVLKLTNILVSYLLFRIPDSIAYAPIVVSHIA